MGSYCLYRASCPLWKGISGVSPSTDFETMASHDAGVVYFTEYLSVLFQLTYLDELYGECNGTVRACVNCGYQALFSPITERLGTRLLNHTEFLLYITCCVFGFSVLTIKFLDAD